MSGMLGYLRMSPFIRQNELMRQHLDPEQFQKIFWQIRNYPEKPQSKRIVELFELFGSLHDGLSATQRGRIISRLRHVLSGYRWEVQVSPSREWFRASYFPADEDKLSEDDQQEYRVVRVLLDLLPLDGKMHRIRRCAEPSCKKWFFAATRGDQRFCSENCRKRHYDSDPKNRENKKRYMRRHRENKRKREERAKNARWV